MTKKDISTGLVAVLGVVLGVMLTVTFDSVFRSSPKVKASYDNWQKLNLILDIVQKKYVDTLDVKAVSDAAVVGALSELDPHSVYLPPQQLESSEEELARNFEGIGIQFNVPNDTAIVLEVISGGPSEKVGLMPGDRILKVDDKVIAGVKFPQDSMVRRMKGPAGTKVLITVGRDNETIPFEITRGKIPLHCVDAAFMIDETTGYIRLSKFSRSTYKEVSEAAMKLLGEGMQRLVFDLRENSGGYLDQALVLSNLFLEKGDEIVYLQGRKYPRENNYADGRGFLKKVGLAVLIDENSASSSEIFAGAIQDNDRGLIAGRRSFGKGLVQDPVTFTDGSGIRLTVARFYTPSGRCIQKPYSKDYQYDIYRRYVGGEMFSADSMKVDSTKAFTTKGGRTVYGGGGIVPDLFIPMDTTRASKFFIACNKKAVQMRFAAATFDRYKSQLSAIGSFEELDTFFDKIPLKDQFLAFAKTKESIVPAAGEWEQTESYLMPQLRALVGRYSKVGENAYYRYYLPVDDVVQKTVGHSFEVDLPGRGPLAK